MDVHLLRTPGYSAESFEDVCDLLNSYPGLIQFKNPDYTFSLDDFPFLQNDVLTWEELLGLCMNYRSSREISAEDYVILLTEKSNELNWFSYTDMKRNGFVHAEGWDNFVKADQMYPVAYQVAENILQSELRLDTTTAPNEYIHERARGCINDFCSTKEDISIKLRTGDICVDCKRRAIDLGVNLYFIVQILSIVRGIRDQFLFTQERDLPLKPVKLVVNISGRIELKDLGNFKIKLTPVHKALYIFYLRHLEGIRRVDLPGHKKELLEIYQRLARNDDNEAARQSVARMIDEDGFSEIKSTVNRSINKLLGKKLADHYRIEGLPGSAFKINLDQELIDIQL